MLQKAQVDRADLETPPSRSVVRAEIRKTTVITRYVYTYVAIRIVLSHNKKFEEKNYNIFTENEDNKSFQTV